MISTSETIVGKNIGKKNETTDHEQALKELESKAKKKRDAGYGPLTGKKQINTLPMLAQDFKKQKNIKYPVYVQPKLDGYRAMYDGASDKLLTRTGKEYDILKNTPLHKELQKFKLVLDGELYVHDKDFLFEAYGILRKKKLSPGDSNILDKIVYNVYDIMMPGPFSERLSTLKTLIKDSKYIKLVKTYECKDKTCIDKFHNEFLEDNYEGSMIRSQTGEYTNNRSKDLLKYKNFDDAEFKVIGFEKETDTKGDGASPVVWVCETDDGKSFKVPSKGTREERTKLYNNGKKYIGKLLTVQFFGYTKDGIPRFPKTLRGGASSFRVMY
jgi:ATP-dependent DNA ligase